MFYKEGKFGCFVLLNKRHFLEDNLPYVQYGFWYIQSNMSKLHLRNTFLCATWVQRSVLPRFNKFFPRERQGTNHFSSYSSIVSVIGQKYFWHSASCIRGVGCDKVQKLVWKTNLTRQDGALSTSYGQHCFNWDHQRGPSPKPKKRVK